MRSKAKEDMRDDLRDLASAAELRGDQYAFQLVRELLVPLAEALNSVAAWHRDRPACTHAGPACHPQGDYLIAAEVRDALALVKKYVEE